MTDDLGPYRTVETAQATHAKQGTAVGRLLCRLGIHRFSEVVIDEDERVECIAFQVWCLRLSLPRWGVSIRGIAWECTRCCASTYLDWWSIMQSDERLDALRTADYRMIDRFGDRITRRSNEIRTSVGISRQSLPYILMIQL